MPQTSEQTVDTGGVKVRVHPARPVVVGLAAVALVVGAFGLYEMARQGGNPAGGTGACADSLARAKAINALVHGEVAALMPATTANDLSAIAFDDAEGHPTSVGAFKGRTILLNLWATWCVPCRAEMPALDKLASSGPKDFAVVPVNIDTARLDKPPAFLKEIGATNLPFYSDKTAGILQALKKTGPIDGLPTSILIGKDGCAIGTMAGPAVWDSPDAKALVAKASS